MFRLRLNVANGEAKRTWWALRTDGANGSLGITLVLAYSFQFSFILLRHLGYLLGFLLCLLPIKDLRCLAQDITDSVNLACILVFVSLLFRPT